VIVPRTCQIERGTQRTVGHSRLVGGPRPATGIALRSPVFAHRPLELVVGRSDLQRGAQASTNTDKEEQQLIRLQRPIGGATSRHRTEARAVYGRRSRVQP
jgi:hypothetical protein